MVAAGIPDRYARLLASLEESRARGSEDRTTGAVLRITGSPPRSFRALVQARTRAPA